jgi:hypothetical protein
MRFAASIFYSSSTNLAFFFGISPHVPRNKNPSQNGIRPGLSFVMFNAAPCGGCIGIQAECSSAVNRPQRMPALRNKSPSRVGSLAGAKSELSLIHPDGDRDAIDIQAECSAAVNASPRTPCEK